MPSIRTMALLLTGAVFLLLNSCNQTAVITPDTAIGNGSGVGTGLISGMLYEPDGQTPAGGAVLEVRFKNQTVDVNSAAAKSKNTLLTAVTNTNGQFSFDTIADGLYTIEGSDNKGNMVLYDSVVIHNPTSQITLPAATLTPAGAITGAIALDTTGNHFQIFILAFGVDRFCQVKEDGTFAIPPLPAGVYTLKIFSLDQAYKSIDTTGIEVRSGETTDIGTITLERYKVQPVPQISGTSVNSMLMNSTFTWEPLPDSITAGYNIYRSAVEREDGQQPALRLNGETLHKNTTYTDNTFFKLVSSSRAIDTVIYTVTMVDISGNESSPSSPITITVPTPWERYESHETSITDVITPNLYVNPENGYFICYGEQSDKVDDLSCTSYSFYRISFQGDLLQSATMPDVCNDGYIHMALLQGTDSDEIGFLLNVAQPAIADNDEISHVLDSVFVCTVAASGEISRQQRLPPDEEGGYTDAGGIIRGRELYYRVDNDRIRRINLDSGNNVPFLDLNNNEARIRSLLPGPDDGFIAEVYYVDSVNLLIYRHECLFFDALGTVTETVSLPRIEGTTDFNEKGDLIAVHGNIFYFDNYFGYREPDDSFTWNIMPLRRFSSPAVVRDDGTVLVIETGYKGTTLHSYRLKNHNQQQ